MTEEFKALNCQLAGLSVDGVYSHIAWLRTIREKIEYKGKKNVKVQFPLIADVIMEVAHLYGMIQPRARSMRPTNEWRNPSRVSDATIGSSA